MINLKNTKEYQYLLKLDEKMSNKNIKNFDLYIIGGFSLLIYGLKEQTPDIDSLEKIPNNIKECINEVANEFNIFHYWLNDDASCNDKKDILESIIGKLYFEKIEEMNNIRIYILKPIYILQLKIIALEESFVCIQFKEKFSREKDFIDIKNLMAYLNFNIDDVKKLCDWIVNKEIFNLIDNFLKTNDIENTINLLYHFAKNKF